MDKSDLELAELLNTVIKKIHEARITGEEAVAYYCAEKTEKLDNSLQRFGYTVDIVELEDNEQEEKSNKYGENVNYRITVKPRELD